MNVPGNFALVTLLLAGVGTFGCSVPCEDSFQCGPFASNTSSTGTGGAATTSTGGDGSGGNAQGGGDGGSGGSEPPVALFVAASGQHTCASVSNGSTWCWGSNFNGALATVAPVQQSTIPVESRLLDADAMSGGIRNMCAIKDGQVWCWGDGEFGALGNNQDDPSSTPVRAGTLDNVTSLSGTGEYYCAVALGQVWCWGNGTYWNLGGAPPPGNNSEVPVNLIGLTDATAVSTADRYACALRTGGSVTCWGDNEQASLPGPNTPSSLLDANVQTIASSAFSSHTCFTRFDRVWCWGSAHSSGATTTAFNPTEVQGLDKVTAFDVGGNHTCAIVAGEGVYCWGAPPANGRNVVSNVPQLIPGTQNAMQVSAGFLHACAVLANGSVVCWGKNDDGRLGDGSTNDSTKAETVFPSWQN